MDLLKPAEVGIRLRCHKRTLATWRSAGYGPAYVRVGSRIFYPAENLEAFLEQQERTAAQEQVSR
jgi:hypothetical protein